MSTPRSVLKSTFGFDSFRPHQLDVIDNILARHDSLAVMPTGGGKSLCYQIPALLFEGLTVVVSPLISLMKDQVEQLRDYGVPAVVLNSSIPRDEYQANMRAVQNCTTKLLYLAPETLLTPRILSLLSSTRVDMLTIDEAHCISEWGHDFRPEYRRMIEVRELLPNAVCLALTATATPRVREDIRSSLKFTSSNEIVASFNRDNLFIEVTPKRDALKQTELLLERFKDQSGIIYCFSRKQVDEIAAYLSQRGFSTRPYHAGLDDAERRKNQEAFIRDDVQIMVATIAFGMGINKPNVRFVIHYDLPKSIEGYYQEIGRAGRDGLPAHCLLLYSYADAAKQRYFIDQKEGDEQRVAALHLESMVRFAEGESNCRRKPLLAYFGEFLSILNCNNCDNCTSAPEETADITLPAQKFLSCVKRAGERFGAGHVADVLMGSTGEKVLKFGHQQLSTYGIGKELTKDQWMNLARQLVKLGFLEQEAAFRTLRLTPKALDTLKRRAPIMGAALKARDQGRVRAEKIRPQDIVYDDKLFELLRRKRKELADAANLPPYVVFPDRTLIEMAAYYPQRSASLLDINGVGRMKMMRYGDEFLAVIRSYCKQNNLSENLPAPGYSPYKAGGDSNSRYLIIGQSYASGETAESIMRRFQIKLTTILDHLTKYVTEGNSLGNTDDLQALISASVDDQRSALEGFDELGSEFLKPVFERLGARASYDDLRILRIIHLNGSR
jgi:ATP-dependent DNA helicase RecQ